MDPLVTLMKPSVADYSLCLHILSSSSGILNNASEHELTTVKQAANVQKSLGILRILILLIALKKCWIEAQDVVWHKKCNAHFTDKSKLERLQKTQAQAADSEPEASCSDTELST